MTRKTKTQKNKSQVMFYVIIPSVIDIFTPNHYTLHIDKKQGLFGRDIKNAK